MSTTRVYSEVVRRLRRAAANHLQRLCQIGGLDWWWLETGPQRNPAATLILTGGIHGDEPAGVEAILRFLEQPTPGWARRIRFTIFPCMNPYGLDHHQRGNYAGLDINRFYHTSDLPEIAAQKRVLQGRRFDLHLTLHEDVDALGFYVYELSRRGPSIARRILRNISPVIRFDSRGVIERRRANRGLIQRTYPPRGMKGWPESIYMFAEHTDHTLTTETPGPVEWEKRVVAQLIALRTACESIQS
jgi:predicted deacylase